MRVELTKWELSLVKAGLKLLAIKLAIEAEEDSDSTDLDRLEAKTNCVFALHIINRLSREEKSHAEK